MHIFALPSSVFFMQYPKSHIKIGGWKHSYCHCNAHFISSHTITLILWVLQEIFSFLVKASGFEKHPVLWKETKNTFRSVKIADLSEITLMRVPPSSDTQKVQRIQPHCQIDPDPRVSAAPSVSESHPPPHSKHKHHCEKTSYLHIIILFLIFLSFQLYLFPICLACFPSSYFFTHYNSNFMLSFHSPIAFSLPFEI